MSVDGVYAVICSLGDSEQNIYIFSAVSQADYRVSAAWKTSSWSDDLEMQFWFDLGVQETQGTPAVYIRSLGREPFSCVWKINCSKL